MPTNSYMQGLDPDILETMRRHQEAFAQAQRQGSQGSNAIGAGQSMTWTVNPSQVYGMDMANFVPQTRRSLNINELLRGRRREGEDNMTDLQRRRKREKDEVERFINSGSSEQDKYVDESGTLMVNGYDMGDTHVLFTMNKDVITAQEKRTKHLKPLLTKLAKREGLELVLLDTPPEPISGGRQIVYYTFKNQEEVDDTGLVTVTQPVFRGGFSSHSEGCGDVNCNDCYGGDEDDEDDEDEESEEYPSFEDSPF